MSVYRRWLKSWLSVAADAGAEVPPRGGRHEHQYLVKIIESVLVALGGTPKTSAGWNQRIAYAIQQVAQLSGQDSGEWTDMTWNDKVVRGTEELAASGISVGGFSWVKLTAAMWDAGDDVTTNSTLKSASFDGNHRLSLTANAIAATRDGHREVSGKSIPIASVLTFDPETQDIAVYVDGPDSGADANLIGTIAIVENPGAAGNGVGIAVSETRVAHQGNTAVDSSITDAGLTAAFARLNISDSTVSCSTQAKGSSNGGEFYAVPGTAANTTVAATTSGARIFVGLGSYSGAQSEDEVWSGDIYFAAVPKIDAPA